MRAESSSRVSGPFCKSSSVRITVKEAVRYPARNGRTSVLQSDLGRRSQSAGHHGGGVRRFSPRERFPRWDEARSLATWRASIGASRHDALCKQFSSCPIIRQIAKFWLYDKIAICNHSGMTFLTRRLAVACAPRPWLTRDVGECAFPVDGAGVTTRACCNPCTGDDYCPAHAAAMRRPPTTSAAELELEIIRFLERGR